MSKASDAAYPMTSALVLSSSRLSAPPPAADLEAAGVEVQGETNCPSLLQDVIGKQTEVAACFQKRLDERMLVDRAKGILMGARHPW